MQFFGSPANQVSRYSQDTAPADLIETNRVETGQIGHQSAQIPYLRHSLPVQGLRYRSDAYCSAQPVKPISRFVLPVIAAAEYEKAHQLYIQQRLQHRIAVATASGDRLLVKLLQCEMQQAQTARVDALE